MIEDSFYKWLNDELFFLGELATKSVNGLLTMKAKELITETDFKEITSHQLEAYDNAVLLSYETKKRMFKKGLTTAINKQDYYLHEVKKTKKILKNSDELNNVLAGGKQYSTISGSQYKKIREGFEGYFMTKQLQYAGYAFNRNMSIASTYKYLKWLEDNNPETININPEYVKFWNQFNKKPAGADKPYLTDEEINEFLNQAFGDGESDGNTFNPDIDKIELRHAASLFISEFKYDKTKMAEILKRNFPELFKEDIKVLKESIRNNLDNGKRIFNLK